MTDFDTVSERTWGNGDDCLRVHIFAENGVSREELDIAYDALTDAVGQVYNDDERASNIDYAQVLAHDANEDLPCSGDDRQDRRENMRQHIHEWLTDHNFTEQGCYLWLTECGVGNGQDGAWNGTAVAFISTDWYRSPDDYLGAMAIHESLHTYINHGCDDVSNRTDGNEHDLGTVTSYDNVTPLAASYENSEKYHENGNCSGQNPDSNSYTYWLSGCTRRSVSDSLEHKNAWFHDGF